MEIQVTFEIGSNADQAALNVNNRVKQAEARLPEEVRRQGVTVEKGSSAFLLVYAFYSPDDRFDDLYTSNYATLNVLDTAQARAEAPPTSRSSAPRITRCGSGSCPTA